MVSENQDGAVTNNALREVVLVASDRRIGIGPLYDAPQVIATSLPRSTAYARRIVGSPVGLPK